jgi:hypothetical protein
MHQIAQKYVQTMCGVGITFDQVSLIVPLLYLWPLSLIVTFSRTNPLPLSLRSRPQSSYEHPSAIEMSAHSDMQFILTIFYHMKECIYNAIYITTERKHKCAWPSTKYAWIYYRTWARHRDCESKPWCKMAIITNGLWSSTKYDWI